MPDAPHGTKLVFMKAYRASLLRFADDQSPVFEADGLLVVGPTRLPISKSMNSHSKPNESI